MSATYATLADFKEYLGSSAGSLGTYEQLTDRVAHATADDAVGQALLDAAQARVDVILTRAFNVPMDAAGNATLGTFLKDCTCAVAAYLGWSTAGKAEVPKKVVALYDEVMSLLKQACASGSLPGASPTTPTAEAVGSERVCTKEAMEGL